MYFDTSLKTSRVDLSTLPSPRSDGGVCHWLGTFPPPKNKDFWGNEEEDEVSDQVTEDTTMGVRIEEEMRVIR
jgi:hypothetical protein